MFLTIDKISILNHIHLHLFFNISFVIVAIQLQNYGDIEWHLPQHGHLGEVKEQTNTSTDILTDCCYRGLTDRIL